MILNFYTTDDADNVINKQLGIETGINVVLKKDFDIKSPTFVVVNTDTFNCLDFNYCALPELNRFYYIDGIDSLGNNRYKVSCSTDVLETYKQDILNSDARFYRGIQAGDYVDGDLITTTKNTISLFDSNVTLDDTVSKIMITVEDKGE